MEARIKVPAGHGMWPAFWLLGSNFSTVGWPDCGEIDIMEYIGREPDLIMGTMHGPGYSGALGLSKWNRQPYNIADDFHTYAVEWTPKAMDFSVDGRRYFTFENEGTGPAAWPFDRPCFLILNVAVGGDWGGQKGIDDAIFPQKYYVAYVRVYQRQK